MRKGFKVLISLILAVMLVMPVLPAGIFAGRVYTCSPDDNRVTYGKYACWAENGSWPDGANRSTLRVFMNDSALFANNYVGLCTMEVDICPLAANAEITAFNVANQPNGGFIEYKQSTGKIGANGVTVNIATPWHVGEWHHVTVYSNWGTIGSVIAVDGEILSSGNNITSGAQGRIGQNFVCLVTNCAIDNIYIYQYSHK